MIANIKDYGNGYVFIIKGKHIDEHFLIRNKEEEEQFYVNLLKRRKEQQYYYFDSDEKHEEKCKELNNKLRSIEDKISKLTEAFGEDDADVRSYQSKEDEILKRIRKLRVAKADKNLFEAGVAGDVLAAKQYLWEFEDTYEPIDCERLLSLEHLL